LIALPDGIYLILNGAQQVNAGFGLATDPNHNALLYDPRQPIRARMTIMANTTIACLHHFAAVLMDNGRVLVSDSDPQDPTHPEEMLFEVFNPPYIINIDPSIRPSFTLANGECFAYADAITIAITGAIPSAILLPGAVASTHGNSMGHRTICILSRDPTAIGRPVPFVLWLTSGDSSSSVGSLFLAIAISSIAIPYAEDRTIATSWPRPPR